MPVRGPVLALSLLAAAAVDASAARSSTPVAFDAKAVRIQVTSDSNTATVSYTSGGKQVVASVCCGLNARPAGVQVKLRVVYGPVGLPGTCGRYDGPKLPYVVKACKAPDGSYWVAQSWPRALPNQGRPPTAEQAKEELRVSHFRGELPVLTVKQDWAFNGQWDHLYGSLRYLSRPLPGAFLALDTRDSQYGPGWRRDSALVTHRPNGIFCAVFIPRAGRPAGTGKAYRVTAIGPGGLPDLVWQGVRRPYNEAEDEAANAEQAESFSDSLCRPN